jgi:hypothetical protein
MGRVDMTKMDHRSFTDAMRIRGDNKHEALQRLLAHKLPGKPLIVEGVEDPDYLTFLAQHWDEKEHGQLYGQGYCLETGEHWSPTLRPLKPFGLPGGDFLLQ